MLPGVYSAFKKNGNRYYRSSITHHGKHISLGSYQKETDAHSAYMFANEILSNSSKWSIETYPSKCILSFHKWVVLHNLKDNQIYFKNPIYLKQRYFIYYIDINTTLKFDVDDLFYYAHHKILKRGGHLFVSDYGMQVNMMSRYGIINYAVAGKDFLFANGDDTDFRYGNIKIINHYYGVTKILQKGRPEYLAKIHVRGDYVIGRYQSEIDAAIAYNKAALILLGKGLKKNFSQNYIEGIDDITYASIYQRLRISKRILSYMEQNS